MTETTTAEPMIGPLSPAEWMTFFLPDDDDRNPLPACCVAVSETRDTIAGILRLGGDPDLCWRMMTLKWPTILKHVSDDLTGPDLPARLVPLRKLHDAYVAGRRDPRPDEIDWDNAKARMQQYPAGKVGEFVDQIPETFVLKSTEDRMRVVARLGGMFVAYVYDQAERGELIARLADMVGLPLRDVALMIDVLRLRNGLPWADDTAAAAR